MRATVYHGPRDMRIDQVPDPIIAAPTDVVARITHAGICGSDLWSYRGILDMTVDLDGVPVGYAAMDSREAIKVIVLP